MQGLPESRETQQFAADLLARTPRQGGGPSELRKQEREATAYARRNETYTMLSDDDDGEAAVEAAEQKKASKAAAKEEKKLKKQMRKRQVRSINTPFQCDAAAKTLTCCAYILPPTGSG